MDFLQSCRFEHRGKGRLVVCKNTIPKYAAYWLGNLDSFQWMSMSPFHQQSLTSKWCTVDVKAMFCAMAWGWVGSSSWLNPQARGAHFSYAELMKSVCPSLIGFCTDLWGHSTRDHKINYVGKHLQDHQVQPVDNTVYDSESQLALPLQQNALHALLWHNKHKVLIQKSAWQNGASSALHN